MVGLFPGWSLGRRPTNRRRLSVWSHPERQEKRAIWLTTVPSRSFTRGHGGGLPSRTSRAL